MAAPDTPADVADLFDGYTGRWWVAGGWALEAFTGVSRPHGDVDPSVPRGDLPLLRRHLAGRIDLWSADQETLRFLVPGDVGQDSLAETCENVWARSSGGEPWEYDIILMGVEEDVWVSRRTPGSAGPWGRSCGSSTACHTSAQRYSCCIRQAVVDQRTKQTSSRPGHDWTQRIGPGCAKRYNWRIRGTPGYKIYEQPPEALPRINRQLCRVQTAGVLPSEGG